MMWWLGLWLFACGGAGTEVGVREGMFLPDFETFTLEGQPVGLKDLRGRPSLLVFWASWCGPCKKEVPEINKLYKSYRERVHFLGVNMAESPEKVQMTQSQLGMLYPSAMDMRSELATRFAVSSIPLVIIIDSEGRIRYRGNGLPLRAHAVMDGLLLPGSQGS